MIALVTGGNRGLGLETCRQLAAAGHTVVLAARREGAARDEAEALGVEHLQLDVSDEASIAAGVDTLRKRHEHIDVLVNNAGVALDGFDADVVKRTLSVNLFGAMHVTDAMRPLLGERGTVVMVSSGMGDLSCVSGDLRKQLDSDSLTRDQLIALATAFLSDPDTDGWPRSAYRASKVTLNALTRILMREAHFRVCAVCPGWVRTDMGGHGAARSVEDGARGIVWAATASPDGGFYRDGKRIDW